jgi:hypothetical protein
MACGAKAGIGFSLILNGAADNSRAQRVTTRVFVVK